MHALLLTLQTLCCALVLVIELYDCIPCEGFMFLLGALRAAVLVWNIFRDMPSPCLVLVGEWVGG